MQVLGYTPQRHERFYSGADRAFGWDSYNWTGIGKDSTGTYFCTLISPSYFISANHWHPANGATIRWYKTNDLTGAYIEGTVLSGQFLNGGSQRCRLRLMRQSLSQASTGSIHSDRCASSRRISHAAWAAAAARQFAAAAATRPIRSTNYGIHRILLRVWR